jgi:hypothetical protein
MSAAASIIHIASFRRIWRVTLDGVFYGDYRSLRIANESAESAAEFLRVGGRSVQIVTAPET